MEKCVHTLGKQTDADARTPRIISRHNKYSPPPVAENTIVTNYSNQWEYKQTKPQLGDRQGCLEEVDLGTDRKYVRELDVTGRQRAVFLTPASLRASIPSNTQINK